MRHLSFISELTREPRYIKDVDNVAMDALPRIEAIFSSPLLTHDALAAAEGEDEDLSSTSKEFTPVPLPFSSESLLCDSGTGINYNFVPVSLRKTVLRALHDIDHPEIRPTEQNQKARFV